MLREMMKYAIAVGMLQAACFAAGAFNLITENEAKLPPGEMRSGKANIPGPTIQIVAPSFDATLELPVRFVVRFTPYARSGIDLRVSETDLGENAAY